MELETVEVINNESKETEEVKIEPFFFCTSEKAKKNHQLWRETTEKLKDNRTQFGNFILSLDYEKIGPKVCGDTFIPVELTNIHTTCRRKFGKYDVLVYVNIDDPDEYGKGMVFTEKGIFYWENEGEDITEIDYSNIENVDYKKNTVEIKFKKDEHFIIELGQNDDNHPYGRNMYNFIMDILDYDDSEVEELGGNE